MAKLKIIFWLIGVVILGGGGAYVFANSSDSQLAQKLSPYTQQFEPIVATIKPVTEQISVPSELPTQDLPEVATLTERGKELSEHVGAVLGESVAEVDAEKQPLHERAVEYGQYLYCKGIVEEYEGSHTIDLN